MYKKSNRQPIRKRSFLLFELLVALGLIALCLYPLVKPHALMHKKEIERLVEMQLEQISQTAFCQIKEKLYKHEHSWKELNQEAKGELEPVTVVTGKNSIKKLPCSYTIKQIDHCNKKKPLINALVVEIQLKFNNSDKWIFTRTLYLERRAEA